MNTEHQSLHEQLVERCLPYIKYYKEDLLVHDKDAIKAFPGVPFIHWTRDCGTQILLLRPHDHDSWPKTDGELKPFIFSQCDRRKMIYELSEIAKYFAKPDRDQIHKVLHFDGSALHEITKEKAVEIAIQWRRDVDSGWNKQGNDTLCAA